MPRRPAQRLRPLPALCALLLAVSAGNAGAAAPAESKGPATEKSRSALLYHNYCSVCHGDRGDGRSRASNSFARPPRDFTNEASRKELTRERLVSAIGNGVPGTAMVGWKTQLNEADITALAGYIETTFMRPNDNPALARGRTIYMGTCAVCHGDRGQGMAAAAPGQKPPRDFRSPQAAAELTRERMLASVQHGVPGTAMASFKSQLSQTEMEAVIDFVRTSIMLPSTEGVSGVYAHGGREKDKAAAPGIAADMSLPLPVKLAADAAKGRAFYMANCATCHGAKGDGQGPRAYFINPKPKNLIEDASRRMFNRPALYAAISEGKLGTEMPAWNKVLNEQEMANVTEFVFREFIRPPAPQPAARAAAK